MAGTDPKEVFNQSEKLAKHLENFEKRKLQYDADITKATKLMRELQGLSESVLKSSAEQLKIVDELKVAVANGLKDLEGLQVDVRKGGDFDMVYRRFLDARKAYRQIAEEFAEKSEKLRKNRGDTTAQKEFEIAEKALVKFGRQFSDLDVQSQSMMPSRTLQIAERVSSDLLRDLVDLDKALRVVYSKTDNEALHKYSKRFELLRR